MHCECRVFLPQRPRLSFTVTPGTSSFENLVITLYPHYNAWFRKCTRTRQHNNLLTFLGVTQKSPVCEYQIVLGSLELCAYVIILKLAFLQNPSTSSCSGDPLVVVRAEFNQLNQWDNKRKRRSGDQAMLAITEFIQGKDLFPIDDDQLPPHHSTELGEECEENGLKLQTIKFT